MSENVENDIDAVMMNDEDGIGTDESVEMGVEVFDDDLDTELDNIMIQQNERLDGMGTDDNIKDDSSNNFSELKDDKQEDKLDDGGIEQSVSEESTASQPTQISEPSEIHVSTQNPNSHEAKCSVFSELSRKSPSARTSSESRRRHSGSRRPERARSVGMETNARKVMTLDTCKELLAKGTDAYCKGMFLEAEKYFTKAEECVELCSYMEAHLYQSAKYLLVMCCLHLSTPKIDESSYWKVVLGESLQARNPDFVDPNDVQKWILAAKKHLDQLRAFCQKHKKTFLLLYVVGARYHLRCLSQPDAMIYIEEGSRRMAKGQPIYYPGTHDIIEESKIINFSPLFASLTSEAISLNTTEPLFVCRFANCSNNYPKRESYKFEPGFDGYYEVECTQECIVHYHHLCFKEFEKDTGRGQAFFQSLCPTPDCGAQPQIYKEYGANYQLKVEVEEPTYRRKKKQKLQQQDQLSSKNLRKLGGKKPANRASGSSKSESESTTSNSTSFFNMKPIEPIREPTPDVDEDTKVGAGEKNEYEWREEEEEETPPPDLPAVPIERQKSNEGEWQQANQKKGKKKKREQQKPLPIDILLKSNENPGNPRYGDGWAGPEREKSWVPRVDESVVSSPSPPPPPRFIPPVQRENIEMTEEQKEKRIKQLENDPIIQDLFGLITGIINENFKGSRDPWTSIDDLALLLLSGGDQSPVLSELICLCDGELINLLMRQRGGRFSFIVDRDDGTGLVSLPDLLQCSDQLLYQQEASIPEFYVASATGTPLQYPPPISFDPQSLVQESAQEFQSMVDAWNKAQPQQFVPPDQTCSIQPQVEMNFTPFEPVQNPQFGAFPPPSIVQTDRFVQQTDTVEEPKEIEMLKEQIAQLEEQLETARENLLDQGRNHLTERDNLEKLLATEKDSAKSWKNRIAELETELMRLKADYHSLKLQATGVNPETKRKLDKATTENISLMRQVQEANSRLSQERVNAQEEVKSLENELFTEKERAVVAESAIFQLKRKIALSRLCKHLESIKKSIELAQGICLKLENKGVLHDVVLDLSRLIKEWKVNSYERLQEIIKNQAAQYDMAIDSVNSGVPLCEMNPVDDPELPPVPEVPEEILRKLGVTVAPTDEQLTQTLQSDGPMANGFVSSSVITNRSGSLPPGLTEPTRKEQEQPIKQNPTQVFQGVVPAKNQGGLESAMAGLSIHPSTDSGVTLAQHVTQSLPVPPNLTAVPQPPCPQPISSSAAAADSNASPVGGQPKGVKVQALKEMVMQALPNVTPDEFKCAVTRARNSQGTEGFKKFNGNLELVSNAIVVEIRRARVRQAAMEGVAEQPTAPPSEEELSTTERVTGEMVKPNEHCQICLELMARNDQHLHRCRQCQTIYHENCLRSWVEKNATCPNCRRHMRLDNDYPALA